MQITWRMIGTISPWVIMLVGGIIMWTTIRNQVSKHEKLLTSGPNGTPPFITEPQHVIMQNHCQSQIYQKINNMETTMETMNARMERGDQCRSESREETSGQLSAIRKDIRRFQKDMFDIINPLVTQVALSEAEIRHITENNGVKE